MFDSIKSKLGLGDTDGVQGGGRYDEYEEYGQDYDDYDGYDDYSQDYGDYGDSGSAAYTSSYGSSSNVTTRPANDRASRLRTRSSVSPHLVSYSDVKSSTQLPDSLNRDPLPARHVTPATRNYRKERTLVDSSLPHSLTPEGAAETAAAGSAGATRSRSAGLDSLFEPSDTAEASTTYSHASTGDRSYGSTSASDTRYSVARAGSASYSPSRASEGFSSSTSSRSSFDPYEAYSGNGSTSFSTSRNCVVLKPASYDEVERIAKVLKGGDAVVLSLKNTPDSLSKRILDFSFGVSSALDASVECVADKVFAITRGSALNDTDRANLRAQGVL